MIHCRHSRPRYLGTFVIGALALLFGNTQAANYTVTDLGANIQPLSISDSGLIVGIDTTNPASPQAVYRNGNTWLPLSNSSSASAVSTSGLIAGHIINSPNRAQLWRDGQPINELDAFSNILEARDVNGLDEVVGVRKLETGLQRPFIFDYITGSLKTLTTLGGAEGWANAINLHGQVTGSAQDENAQPIAFIYSSEKNTMSELNTLEGFTGSEGLSLTESGTVAGWAFNGTSTNAGRRAILASVEKGLVNLGALDKDSSSVAKGINNSEIVVGQSIASSGTERAFIYQFADTELLTVSADPGNANRVLTGDTNGAGIYQSSDRGDSWNEINVGLNNKKISCIVFNEIDPNIIYACTAAGLYKSTNGGTSWLFSSTNMDKPATTGTTREPAHVYNVLIDSGDRNHLFAGADAGLFESKDAGASWTQILDVQAAVYDVIKQPGARQFFAATTRGVYRFRENAPDAKWQLENGDSSVNANPPTGINPRLVATLAIDPKDPTTLFAGTLGGSVYVSTISDTSVLAWSKRNTGMGGAELIYALEFNDQDVLGGKSHLYAGSPRGLFESTDHGTTWTKFSNNFQTGGVYGLSFSFGAVTTLYATTHDGNIWRSDTDGATLGASWENITRGSITGDIYDILSVATLPPSILAGSSRGIFKLAGNSWQATFSAAAGTKVVAMAANTATSPVTYWAATTDKGIYRSSDGGLSWATINSGLTNLNVYALLADTSTSPVRLYAGTMGGVYRSDNNGDSWTLVNAGLNNGNVYSLLLDTSTNPNRLYAGTANGVYRSTDNGNTWVPVNAGLQNTPITSLLLDSSSNIFAASTKSGVFKSANAGITWDSINQTNPAKPLPDNTVYVIKRDSSDNIYAATAKGVYKYAITDWNDINLGPIGAELKQTEVFGLEVVDANKIYAGTNNKGVYYTENAGTSWTVIHDGLTETSVTIQDLTTAVGDGNWEFRDATAINNNGQIIGWGLYQGQPHGYLLTPSNGLLTANLTISQSVYPNTIKTGVPLTFQIHVYNAGPAAATHVQVKDWLPPNTLYRHASTNRGTCVKETEETVRCSLFDLQPGETAIVNVSLQPLEESQKVRNIARVSADQVDANFSDNTTGETDFVQVDRCFIATAAYGSFLDPHVETLRHFRDEILLKSDFGRLFVKYYYQYSPQFARIISEHESLKVLARLVLTPIVYAVAYPIAALLILTLLGGWLVWRRFRNRALVLSATPR